MISPFFSQAINNFFLVSKHHGGRLLETPATRLASGQIVLKNSRNGKYWQCVTEIRYRLIKHS